MKIADSRILITGSHGFVGKHLVKQLEAFNIKELRLPTSEECNFLYPDQCKKAMKNIDIVIHLAAKVGGIEFNRQHPAEMYYENILMGTHLFQEAWKAGVKKFVALGTICAYPKFSPIPFREENLWNGYPEETNAPYGLAKKMLLVQSLAYRQQYGFNSIYLLPVNMYGPGDNVEQDSSHVIPALIKKFVDAKKRNDKAVDVWGSGKATREFLFVDDAAEAIIKATELYDRSDPVNIGANFEISIRELAEKIAKHTGYTGKITWDHTKPDGQPRRRLDTSKAKKYFKFEAKTDLDAGLKKTIEWYTQTFFL